MDGVFDRSLFDDLPLVGIVRGFDAAQTENLATAAAAGGLRNIEVTMNTDGAPSIIRRLRELVGDRLNVGAGTVCSTEALEAALAAGAEFIVTPIVVPDVIRSCAEQRVPVFPGAFTPTEIHQAWHLGATMVKVFPGAQIGPAYIRDIKAVFADVKLMPTGGVTVDSLAEFRRAGADGFGVGGPLFRKERVLAADWEWVEAQARRFAQAFRGLP